MDQSKKIILILALLLITALMPVASAEVLRPDLVDFNKTVAYSDIGLTGTQEIQVWVGNILVMTGNTSAGSMPQPVGDYHVIIKPQLSNRWMNNPVLFLMDGFDYILAFFFPIFIILCMIAIAAGLASYGRRR